MKLLGGIQPMITKQQYVPHVNQQLQLNTLERGGLIGMPNPFAKKVPIGGIYYAPGVLIRGNDYKQQPEKKIMTLEKGGLIKKKNLKKK